MSHLGADLYQVALIDDPMVKTVGRPRNREVAVLPTGGMESLRGLARASGVSHETLGLALVRDGHTTERSSVTVERDARIRKMAVTMRSLVGDRRGDAYVADADTTDLPRAAGTLSRTEARSR